MSTCACHLSDTFWVLVLGVVVLFAFFAALGAFEVGEAVWVTVARRGPRGALAGPRDVGLPAQRRTRSGAPSEPANGADSELSIPNCRPSSTRWRPRMARPRTRCRSSRRAPRTRPRPSTWRARACRSRACATTTVAGVQVRSYEPEDASGTLVYLHGGGWVLGNLESVDAVCRALANESRTRVVSVDYRLAPEHPFPAGLDDALTVDARARGRRRRRRQRGRQPRRGRRPPACASSSSSSC